MVTIRDVELAAVALPLGRPLGTARGVIRERRGAIVVLHAGGLCGLGEALPHPAAPPEAVGETWRALREAAAWLDGADLARLDDLLARVARLPPAAASGVDMALHDLAARARGLELAAVLGGARRAEVPASALLDGDRIETLAPQARAAAAAGFRVAKVKVTSTTAVGRVVVALRAAAPALRLRLDANGCWTREQALAACAALAPSDVEWIEQPVADAGTAPASAAPPDTDWLAELAAVRRGLAVPVAVDESITGAACVGAIAAAAAADVVVVKLVQVGGLAGALAVADSARRAGLGLSVTTSLDTGIGTAAALHLARALPAVRDCGLATTDVLAGDIVRERIASGPRMLPPPGAGLGVTLDRAALERVRVGEAA